MPLAWRFALAMTLSGLAAAQEARGVVIVAPPERRVALVIGNGAYASGPLRNPVNDARAMAEALRRCGFAVREAEDATRERMGEALRAFGEDLRAGGIGLFYFAGHGMQVKGRNYLIPVGGEIRTEDEVAFNALDADAVLAKMETAGNRLNILILDACRNNPFGRGSRSGEAGLAQMNAPAGSYIAFATAPGRTAADGSGANGLYTQHLLANLDTPGLKLEDLFKRVRNGVMQATGDQQVPWESSSLRGDFCFTPDGAPPAAAPAPQVAAARPRDFLEGPEAQQALAGTRFEPPAEGEARLAKLPPLRVGGARLLQDGYDVTNQDLPLELKVEPWAAGQVPVRKGRLRIDGAQARHLCETGLELPLVARFAVQDGALRASSLAIATPGGLRPIEEARLGRAIFYRKAHLLLGIALKFEVEVDGKLMGVLNPGEFFTILMPAGPLKAIVHTSSGERFHQTPLELRVEAGACAYASVDAGGIQAVPPEKGRKASASLKNLGEKVLH